MPVAALDQGIRGAKKPLHSTDDLTPLVDEIGNARIVLLGEASHGTSEFYTWRRRISERLIRERGFSFIGVEGDWPNCYRVNRYVKGMADSGQSAHDALYAFERWPTWMWANEEVVDLAEMLRRHNDLLPQDRRIGFYGLDVYSLWESMDAVIGYLDGVDPESAARARRAYGCFDPYHQDVEEYARATRIIPRSCEDEVVAMLAELRRRAPERREHGRDAYFDAEQNALVATNAERYYRTMVWGGAGSWNVRDAHMVETLARLLDHHGPDSKAIVWEHNTHIGDARATDMARAGMTNVGQLARERWGSDDVVLVGFSTHRGSVIAGRAWGATMEEMPVPPAQQGSWEDLLHRTGAEDKLLLMRDLEEVEGAQQPLGHRAIGVVYDPGTERFGNYVPTVLPLRYDALLYIDESRGVHPLHMRGRVAGEPGETYPSGI